MTFWTWANDWPHWAFGAAEFLAAFCVTWRASGHSGHTVTEPFDGVYHGGPTPEGSPPIPPIFRHPVVQSRLGPMYEPGPDGRDRPRLEPVAGKTVQIAPGVFEERTVYRGRPTNYTGISWTTDGQAVVCDGQGNAIDISGNQYRII